MRTGDTEDLLCHWRAQKDSGSKPADWNTDAKQGFVSSFEDATRIFNSKQLGRSNLSVLLPYRLSIALEIVLILSKQVEILCIEAPAQFVKHLNPVIKSL